MLNRTFWKGRKVLITGHTGFKGSWLCLWLESFGAKVAGYALAPPTQPSLFEQANIAASTPSMLADVRDLPRLVKVLSDTRPDVILHMAAQSVVRRGYEDPVETYSSNVMGTVHVLEAVRQLRLRCAVVNVTSDKCYENREWIWSYRENEPMGGRDPYSNSKGCAELVTSAYRDSYFPSDSFQQHGVALGSARAGNAIGGGDWTSDQLIPDLIRGFLTGKSCLIRNPAAIRPWQFVLEPLRGYLMLAERLSEDAGRFATTWNFGPSEGDAMPVAWIADTLSRLWGGRSSWNLDGQSHPHEGNFLKLDTSKARTYLNWQPVLPLETSLEWIVEWYKAYEAGKDLRKVTSAQIERYESILSRTGASTSLPMPGP
jgi:CDP-glucose 4,6-dehydratase